MHSQRSVAVALMMDEAHTPWKQSRTTMTLVVNALGSNTEERGMGGYTRHQSVRAYARVCSLKHTQAEWEWLTIVAEFPLKRLRLASEWMFKITVFSHHYLVCWVSSPVHQISEICHGHVALSLHFGMPAITATVMFSSDIWLPFFFFLPVVLEWLLLWSV